jgi:hypothetical protein
MFSAEQFEELQKVYPNAVMAQEAGMSYILLPGVQLWEACTPKVVDCLFCPTGRDGYPSRLFFSSVLIVLRKEIGTRPPAFLNRIGLLTHGGSTTVDYG